VGEPDTRIDLYQKLGLGRIEPVYDLHVDPRGDDLINAGKATFIGDRMPCDHLRTPMVAFAPAFEILPGTAPLVAVSTGSCS